MTEIAVYKKKRGRRNRLKSSRELEKYTNLSITKKLEKYTRNKIFKISVCSLLVFLLFFLKEKSEISLVDQKSLNLRECIFHVAYHSQCPTNTLKL